MSLLDRYFSATGRYILLPVLISQVPATNHFHFQKENNWGNIKNNKQLLRGHAPGAKKLRGATFELRSNSIHRFIYLSVCFFVCSQLEISHMLLK